MWDAYCNNVTGLEYGGTIWPALLVDGQSLPAVGKSTGCWQVCQPPKVYLLFIVYRLLESLPAVQVYHPTKVYRLSAKSTGCWQSLPAV